MYSKDTNNYSTNKTFCVDFVNEEYAAAQYQPKTDCIYFEVGDKEEEGKAYGLFLTKQEARLLIHAIHDAMKEARKHGN